MIRVLYFFTEHDKSIVRLLGQYPIESSEGA